MKRRLLPALALAVGAALTACSGDAGPVQGSAEIDYYAVSPTGLELLLTVGFGACSGVQAPDVQESWSEVRVRVPTLSAPSDDDAVCTANRPSITMQVRLEKPLGDRRIIDAGRDAVVPSARR